MNLFGAAALSGGRRLRWFGSTLAAACGGLGRLPCVTGAAQAQGVPAAEPVAAPAERDIAQGLERMRSAPCHRSYAGTFVGLSANGAMSSARIWHGCDGQRQMERVESLSGTPRTVFRRDDEVRTFLPQQRIVRADRRDAVGLFPPVPPVSGTSVGQFYVSRLMGQERVAGFVADVVW